ncbi:hypothetical protein M422DRAFT_24300 [Sphaerobolus stellatus SS14]|nr:hypothetical protein M422DRAFT_24300 [Sphaerobolus stellatus SS14]
MTISYEYDLDTIDLYLLVNYYRKDKTIRRKVGGGMNDDYGTCLLGLPHFRRAARAFWGEKMKALEEMERELDNEEARVIELRNQYVARFGTPVEDAGSEDEVTEAEMEQPYEDQISLDERDIHGEHFGEPPRAVHTPNIFPEGSPSSLCASDTTIDDDSSEDDHSYHSPHSTNGAQSKTELLEVAQRYPTEISYSRSQVNFITETPISPTEKVPSAVHCDKYNTLSFPAHLPTLERSQTPISDYVGDEDIEWRTEGNNGLNVEVCCKSGVEVAFEMLC